MNAIKITLVIGSSMFILWLPLLALLSRSGFLLILSIVGYILIFYWVFKFTK
jgi:hypothetical protein